MAGTLQVRGRGGWGEGGRVRKEEGEVNYHLLLPLRSSGFVVLVTVFVLLFIIMSYFV